MKHRLTIALVLFTGCTLNPPRTAGKCEVPASATPVSVTAPRLDHHQHLLSEGARNVTIDWLRTIDTTYARQSAGEPLVDADQLVAMLNEAGIQKALVFSNAYYFSRSDIEQQGEYEKVKAENDWTLSQISRG